MNAFIALGLRILLLLLAYVFVGWIGILIYRDIKIPRMERKLSDTPAVSLSTQIGEERTTKEFHSPEITIGRDPASDFSLLDETISLQHCRLFFKQKHWWVEDLNSTNGTFVNDDPIEAPVVLVAGDEIRAGRLQIEININDQVRSKS